MKSPASNRRRFFFPGITLTAGYARKRGFIASCANRLSIQGTVATLPLPLSLSPPEIDDKIKIEINPADLRIDVYRASGAGGQHVNRTESAVRITHLPTNTVIQCQSDRSQHRNKATAMKQLSSRLYEMELRNKQQDQKELEGEKSNISWGSQIRSYVLDQSRIKDLRTGIEMSDTQKVLDGDIDPFLKAALKAQI